MRVRLLAAAFCVLLLITLTADERHPMTGVVVSVDPAANSLVVSTDAVPGVMAAMAMTFAVRDGAALKGLTPGTAIEFLYVDGGRTPYAQDIRRRGRAPLDRKQLEIDRLQVLSAIAAPANRPARLVVGERVPEFALIDQRQQKVALSSLAGRVVAMSFGYVRCSNPAYCFRLASNLGQLQSRLTNRIGRDLVLLTLALDPQRDRGAALADYARVWTSQPSGWHFLTGSPEDVARVAGSFGVEFWKDEGQVLHTLKTIVIDRQGRLAASLDGNEFAANQLVDVVLAVLKRP
jgi:protein SCO1/2